MIEGFIKEGEGYFVAALVANKTLVPAQCSFLDLGRLLKTGTSPSVACN